MHITHVGTTDQSPLMVTSLPTSSSYASMPATEVFPVTAGQQTFQLETNSAPAGLNAFFSNQTITVLFVPFGSTGTAAP